MHAAAEFEHAMKAMVGRTIRPPDRAVDYLDRDHLAESLRNFLVANDDQYVSLFPHFLALYPTVVRITIERRYHRA